MQGCVLLRAQIAASGEVLSLTEERREGLSPGVSRCLVEALKDSHFDARSGAPSILSIPITLVQPIPPPR